MRSVWLASLAAAIACHGGKDTPEQCVPVVDTGAAARSPVTVGSVAEPRPPVVVGDWNGDCVPEVAWGDWEGDSTGPRLAGGSILDGASIARGSPVEWARFDPWRRDGTYGNDGLGPRSPGEPGAAGIFEFDSDLEFRVGTGCLVAPFVGNWPTCEAVGASVTWGSDPSVDGAWMSDIGAPADGAPAQLAVTLTGEDVGGVIVASMPTSGAAALGMGMADGVIRLDPSSVALVGPPADLDGDGVNDLGIVNALSLTVFTGPFLGELTAADAVGSLPDAQGVWAADVSGDGAPELVVRRVDKAGRDVGVAIFPGMDLHPTTTPLALLSARLPSVAVDGDLDGDGRADLIGTGLVDGAETWGTAVYVAPFHGVVPVDAASRVWVGDVSGGFLGDLDGNGRTDLFVYHSATHSYRDYFGYVVDDPAWFDVWMDG